MMHDVFPKNFGWIVPKLSIRKKLHFIVAGFQPRWLEMIKVVNRK